MISTSRQLHQDVKQAASALELAIHAVKYSPLVKQRHLQLLKEQQHLQLLKKVYYHLFEMQNFLVEWSQMGEITEADRNEWSERFQKNFPI